MRKKKKNYYGWFPALFLLTLFCCLPKTVSALRVAQPQETPPVVETVPETPETELPSTPETAPEAEKPVERPEKEPSSQPQETPETPLEEPPAEAAEETPEITAGEPSEAPQPDMPEPQPEEPPEEVPQQEPVEVQKEIPPLEDVSKDTLDSFFADTLFIGDSRTVGLCEYSGLTTATFFSDVGMSVYRVLTSQVSVSGQGQTTLEKLLKEKTFGKIHLMLGINELGYDLNTTVNTYTTVVDTIQTLQPEAMIYIGANLHVGKSRSDTDKVINNPTIDRFNNAVAALADGEAIFYVDVNPLFDDGEGNLRADLSGDGTHVYGSCYPQWIQWLYTAMQTEE